MNFSEQADALTKNLADAQKQAWDAWLGMATGAAGKNPAMSMFDPSAWLKPAVDAQNQSSAGVGGATIDRLFSAQSNMMGVMDMITRAWKLVGPNVEAGNPWQPDLQKLVREWTDNLTSTPDRLSSMGSDLQGMFGSMLSDWPGAMAPGMAMMKDLATTGHLGGGGTGMSAAVNRLMEMSSEMHPALGSVGDLPRAGLTREKNAKFLSYADAMMDLRKASEKYRVAMAGALGKAVERTVEKLAKLAEKGEKVTSVRDLGSLWYRTADATLVDTFNSEEFIAIQNEMASSMMDLKCAQREVLELTLQALDIPTRSEIDDAYKIIHELKKEVRQLKKGQAVAKPKAPARRTRKRTKPEAAADS